MARPVPGGPPPAPTVQRLTIRYAKRGRMRFASHRDVARAMERGVRKAGIPVAYSAGFSPHPRISYSGGAPTGAASEAEYLELAVTRRCEPADIRRRLDAALPDGIDVVEVVEADGKAAGLRLEASEWEVCWPGVAPEDAAAAVGAFLAASTARVERLTSKGTRVLDARAAVVSLTVLGDTGQKDTGQENTDQENTARRGGQDSAGACAILRMVVRQMAPAVRPDDVLVALSQSSALAPAAPPLVTRLWQGPLDGLAEAQAGMIVDIEAAEPVRLGSPPASPAADHEPDLQGQGQASPESGPESLRPGRTTVKASRLEAESAHSAPAGQARADGQLPRGAGGQHAGQRAREPYGRDCPDARDRAAEQTVRS
jgi:radical SAM-linked protein